MKPIKKEIKELYQWNDKIIKIPKTTYLCGVCKKTIYNHWKWCPYCGENIERDYKHE